MRSIPNLNKSKPCQIPTLVKCVSYSCVQNFSLIQTHAPAVEDPEVEGGGEGFPPPNPESADGVGGLAEMAGFWW